MVTTLSNLPDPPPDLTRQLLSRRLVTSAVRFETLYGGRTNQVWKVLGEDGDKVLKIYRTDLRNPLFRNDAELEAGCLQALEPTGFVPRLRATGQYRTDHWVLYDHAPGSPWRSGPNAVGVLLRNLHSQKVSISLPKGCNGSADLAAHGQRIMAGCTSDGSERLMHQRPDIDVPRTPDTGLIHGDPVAGNILVSDDRLTLIDWQCPAEGDPCEDLALFLSPAMQRLYRGTPLTPAEVQQFLLAYDNTEVVARYEALRPLYAWRMAAYCVWRAERGATDYADGLQLELALI